MNPMGYAYAAASGALVFMGLDFYIMGAYWEMGFAALGFLLSLWMIRLQPTNVQGGLVVQLDPFKVFQFVDGRRITWCGNKALHDMHIVQEIKPIAEGHAFTVSIDQVCLGHECHAPEVHMERVLTK